MQAGRRGSIYYISAGHMFADMAQGVLPAILPFLISEHGYSYALAASLVFGLNLISSIIQPLFGLLADKGAMPWVLGAGVFLACAGMGFTGLVSSYPLLFIAVTVSGIGVAAFHPEGARWAGKIAAEKKKATALGIFSFGGNIGFALGPMLATPLVLCFGMRGLCFLFLPALVMGALLLRHMHALQRSMQEKSGAEAGPGAPGKDRWAAFGLLCVILLSRSFVFYGMNTFLPLYWIKVFGATEAAASTALSFFLATGALCALFGGRLADRFGLHSMIRAGFLLLLPAAALFALGPSLLPATLLLAPIAAGLYLPFSPMVLLGQKYLPRHVGLASGVSLGLVISVGGLAAPSLGRLADLHGFHPVMHVLACLALIPALAAFFLPKLGGEGR